jgi:hypothetical protein
MKTSVVLAATTAMLLQSPQVQGSPVFPRQLEGVPDLASILLSFLGFADTFFPEAPTLWYVSL